MIAVHLERDTCGRRMSPEPDYGYKSYKGSGKLTDKVLLCFALQLRVEYGCFCV